MTYIVISVIKGRALLINRVDEITTDIILLKPTHVEHIRLIQDMVIDLGNEHAHVAE